MVNGVQQWDPFTPRARRWVLSAVEEFLHAFPNWGEITLLKAGGIDHRLIARIKKGVDEKGEAVSFRTGTIDVLFDTMNKAARGEIQPDAFRNTRTPDSGASQPKGRKNARGPARPVT